MIPSSYHRPNFTLCLVADRQSPEDLLREFGYVTEYDDFFTVDEEIKFREKEFVNKADFENAAVEEDDEETVN